MHQNFAVNRSRNAANGSGLVARGGDLAKIGCAQFIYAPNRENGPPIGFVHLVVDGVLQPGARVLGLRGALVCLVECVRRERGEVDLYLSSRVRKVCRHKSELA